RALHERIVESIRSGLVTTDLKGRIYTFNAAAEEITGHRAESLRGQHVSILFGQIDDHAEAAIKSIGDGRQNPRFEADCLTAEGLRLRLGYSISPLQDERGGTTGLVITFQDLTQVRALEETRRRQERLAAVNTLDVAAYIPAYAAFAVSAALFLAGGRLRFLVLAAIGAATLALVADYVETFTLLAITPALEAQAARLPTSSIAAWTKFAALALHAALLSLMALRDAPRRPIIGVLLLAPAIGLIAAFADRTRLDLLTLGFVVAWVPLLGLAIWRALRPAPAPLSTP
ncbi:MAG TPA: PAS domain S-box protein, partial [Caulobacter sp.]|nr:PAS domain S-box protein [Caulobacter sp.]